jgi:hypothetical protein
MTGPDRKAALAAYKERKTPAGVYAVRCAASGQAWVGHAPDVDAIRNRIWFTVRQGGASYLPLQAACAAHGPDALAFEVLERVEEESALARARVLKERTAHWREQLAAAAI